MLACESADKYKRTPSQDSEFYSVELEVPSGERDWVHGMSRGLDSAKRLADHAEWSAAVDLADSLLLIADERLRRIELGGAMHDFLLLYVSEGYTLSIGWCQLIGDMARAGRLTDRFGRLADTLQTRRSERDTLR
jgi:hypothetical protein